MVAKSLVGVLLLLAALPAAAQDATTAATAPSSLPTPLPANAPAKPPAYTEDTPVETIADNPAAVVVLNKDLPGLLDDIRYPLFKSMSLKQMQQASDGDLSEVDVNKTVSDLQALPPPDLFPH